MIAALMSWLGRFLKWDVDPSDLPQNSPFPATSTFIPTPSPITESSPSEGVVGALDFSTPKAAFHSTRVICDEVDLDYEQKNILCGCVFQESRFLTNPKPNKNIDPKTGKVWSTDYGIVQVNDYWNIGPGKKFSSVQEVIANPEKSIRWMAWIYKTTGELKPWSSYTTQAYVQWLPKHSAMWALAA